MSATARRITGTGALAVLLLALTVLRLWWCGCFELSPDEAYYWLWSQRLDWAYFSKGPGVATAIHLATSVLGDTARGVRWLAPLLALGTTAMLWLLVRDAFSRGVATATAVALQCVPLFNGGALLMTVDALSIFFWTAALLCAWRGLARAAWSAWWPACGFACGLGFLCKYTNALVLAGIVLAVALDPLRRRALADVRGISLVGGFLPCILPPIVWNAQHDWVTAQHLVERGGIGREGSWLQPLETLEFAGVHLLTWSPVLFVMLVMAWPAAWRRARADETREAHAGTRFLLAASAPVLLMYAALALHEAGEANWTGPGIFGLLPIAVAHWHERWTAGRARRWVVAALVTGALLSLLGSSFLPLPSRLDFTRRLRGWKATAEAGEQARARAEAAAGERMPVIANHYGTAAALAFYGNFEPLAPGHPEVYAIATTHPRNQFWFWPSYVELSPAPHRVLFVSDRGTPPPPEVGANCRLVEELPIGEGTRTLRTLRVHECER